MSCFYMLTTGITIDDIVNMIIYIILATFFTMVIWMIMTYSKVSVNFNNKNYHAVIAMRKKLTIGLFNKFPIRNAGLYILAMSYLETGDDEHFLYYMNKVTAKFLLNSKFYVLAIHAIMTNNGKYDFWKGQLATSRIEHYKQRYLLSLEAIEDFLSRKDYNRIFAENIVYFCRSDRVTLFLMEKKNNLFNKNTL